MAIKTAVQGSIPAVNLEYLHTDQFVVTVSRDSPFNIGVTAKVCAYGKDAQGNKVFSPKDKPMLNIRSIDAYIQTKVAPARQAEAVAAMTKIQEAMGVLYDIYYGDSFVGVE